MSVLGPLHILIPSQKLNFIKNPKNLNDKLPYCFCCRWADAIAEWSDPQEQRAGALREVPSGGHHLHQGRMSQQYRRPVPAHQGHHRDPHHHHRGQGGTGELARAAASPLPVPRLGGLQCLRGECKASLGHLETEYRLFPPVTIFLDLFPRAGYFFNAFDWDQRNSKSLIICTCPGIILSNCSTNIIKKYPNISIYVTSRIVHSYFFRFRLVSREIRHFVFRIGSYETDKACSSAISLGVAAKTRTKDHRPQRHFTTRSGKPQN